VIPYGDCVKMYEDLAPNFGGKKLAVASRQHKVSTLTSSPESFLQKKKKHDYRPPLSLLT
jgi:hypothetical protein